MEADKEDKNMNKLKDALKKAKIELRLLSTFLGVDDELLGKYVEAYDSNNKSDVPEDIRKRFDYIVNNPNSSNHTLVAYLMDLEKVRESDEEHPFVKKLFCKVKCFNCPVLIDELASKNIEVTSWEDGIYHLTLYSGRVECEFKLYDSTLKWNEETIEHAMSVETYKDLIGIIKSLKNIYAFNDVKAVLLDGYEKFANAIRDSQPENKVDIDGDIDYPPYDEPQDEPREVTLRRDVFDMIKELEENNTHIDEYKLNNIKNQFYGLVCEIEVLWRGNSFALVRHRFNGHKYICYMCPADEEVDYSLFEDKWEVNDWYYFPINYRQESSYFMAKFAQYIDENHVLF